MDTERYLVLNNIPRLFRTITEEMDIELLRIRDEK
jgi:hypothetical protein